MSKAPANMGSERMFAYRTGRFKGLSKPAWLAASLAFLALTPLALTGCGDSGGSPITISGDDTGAPGGSSDPGDPIDGTEDADQEDVAVIEDWSQTLSQGDVEGAAEFFAVPSTVENGGFRVEIKNPVDAASFNESLPCGAELVGAETSGDTTTATFELSDRPGGDCGSGAGGQAATAFKIEDGKIVEWIRVAVPGGGGEAPVGPDPGAPV